MDGWCTILLPTGDAEALTALASREANTTRPDVAAKWQTITCHLKRRFLHIDPENTMTATDSTQQTLIDVPRVVPPGAFFAVRRTDGETIGPEEWLIVDGPDDWGPASSDARACGEPVEYELVMMVSTRIAVRTFGSST